MMPKSLSFWVQTELALLRLLTAALGLVDGLFNVGWGERLLERMAGRWQARLVQLDASIAALEQERHRLQSHAEALAVHAAAIYLGGRSLTHDELVFDPADPRDEEILDASIEILVKGRLAAIETEEIEKGHYVYCLEPDWIAIRDRLAEAAEDSEADIADWLREGLAFIDETFLSEQEP
jgi:hypothetical protein